jgi:glycosyltransferase involved in cell wall biosynthesis
MSAALVGTGRTVVTVVDVGGFSGGGEKVALDSAILLAEAGFRSILFVAVGPVDPKLTSTPNLEIVVAEDHWIQRKKLVRLRHGVWNRFTAGLMREVLAKLDVQNTIVHVHTFREHVSASALVVADEMGFPLLLTVHEYALGCPMTNFFNVRTKTLCTLKGASVECLKTECTGGSMLWKLEVATRFIWWRKVSHIQTRFDAFIFLSDLSRQVLLPYINPSTPSFRVANPFPVEPRPPQAFAPGRPFAFLAKLIPQKGAVILAEAAARMNAPVIFIGDGPDADRVRELCPNATITGWISPPEVLGHLREARALVFPSTWYEGQPLAIQEALAVGVPVIVSDACAGREAVVDGETGYVFRSGDVDQLVEIMTAMMDDEKAHAMGAAAHRRFWSDPAGGINYAENVAKVYDTLWLSM